MAIIGQDTFARADQSGWGSASDGQTWSQHQGTMTLAVASNEGTATGQTATDNVLLLGNKLQYETNVLVRFKVSAADVPGVVLRSDAAGGTYYRIRNNAGTLGIRRITAGASTAIGTDAGATMTAGTFYWMRGVATGNTITATMWADGTPEPPPQITAIDNLLALPAGQFGIYADIPTTSTDVLSFDSFTATDVPLPMEPLTQPRWTLRALSALLFKAAPSVPLPAWVDRAITATFVRPTSPTNIPRYVRRSLTSLLSNYALNISTRFRLALLKDISTRFVLSGGTQSIRDIATRFRLMQQSVRDIATRFRLKSADQLKDVATRFRLMSASQLKDIATRFRLKSADQLKDIATRFRLAKLNDVATRFRLGVLKDVSTRFRLKSADQLRDIATRFRLGSVRDVATRFRLAKLNDIATRFWLALSNQSIRDIAARFRLMSANQLKDVAARFRLMSASQLKDIASRFRLAQQSLKDVSSRFRLRSADQLKDVRTRFRLMSANQLRDIAVRFVLAGVGVVRTKDIACRFVLVAPASAIWTTRDGKATWLTRDGKATWKTRDGLAAWDARDDKDTWTTRDETVTWKARI